MSHDLVKSPLSNQNYQVGDILKRKINLVADHYGVFIGLYNAIPAVFDIHREDDVAYFRIITLTEFEEGKSSVVVRQARKSDPIDLLGARIQELLNSRCERYNLLGNGGINCEHVARFVVTGIPYCVQQAAAQKAGNNGLNLIKVGLAATAIGAIGVGLHTYFKERKKLEQESG